MRIQTDRARSFTGGNSILHQVKYGYPGGANRVYIDQRRADRWNIATLNHPGQRENYCDREPYRSNYQEILPSIPGSEATCRIFSDTP